MSETQRCGTKRLVDHCIVQELRKQLHERGSFCVKFLPLVVLKEQINIKAELFKD